MNSNTPVETKKAGRPKGSKNKKTLIRQREAKTGVQVKTAKGVRTPPEFKHRISATALKDTYAAANRAHQYEMEFWQWKTQMLKTHMEETGQQIALPPKPVHPLEAKKTEPTFGTDDCVAFLDLLTVVPRALGLECRPNDETTKKAGEAMAKLLRHYPTPDTILADWAMFAIAGVSWAQPWILEYRLKRKGEWAYRRKDFEQLGLVPPERNLREVTENATQA